MGSKMSNALSWTQSFFKGDSPSTPASESPRVHRNTRMSQTVMYIGRGGTDEFLKGIGRDSSGPSIFKASFEGTREGGLVSVIAKTTSKNIFNI